MRGPARRRSGRRRRGARRGAADAPRWWAATAARRARRAPLRRGMSSAPARPGHRARHGAGRARAPRHPLLRQEDLPQAHLLPPLLGSAVGPHRAGLRLRRYAPRMRPGRVDTGPRATPARPALCNPGPARRSIAPPPPSRRGPAAGPPSEPRGDSGATLGTCQIIRSPGPRLAPVDRGSRSIS